MSSHIVEHGATTVLPNQVVLPGIRNGALDNTQKGAKRCKAIFANCKAYAALRPDGQPLTDEILNEGGELAREALDIFNRDSVLYRKRFIAFEGAARSVARAISAVGGGKMLADRLVEIPAGMDRHTVGEEHGAISVEEQEVEEQSIPPEAMAVGELHQLIESGAAAGAPWAGFDEELSPSERSTKRRQVLRLHWPQKKLEAQPLGDDLLTAVNVESVLYWLFKDRFLEKAEADMRRFYASYTGPIFTPDEKRARLKELAAQKLDLEYQLAELAWRDIEAGDVTALLPENISGLAILGVHEVRRTA